MGFEPPETAPPKGKSTRMKPYSFVAFDFKRELLVFRCTLAVPGAGVLLPPVLMPLDCELPWSDIAARGLDIEELKGGGARQRVVMTATCRRPPRYFVKFEEPTDNLYRRRATEMDFTLSDKVGGMGSANPD